MTSKLMAEKIYETLHGQRFDNWYREKFEAYIGDGIYLKITKEDILADIRRLFKLGE